jgi:hypothetical protein
VAYFITGIYIKSESHVTSCGSGNCSYSPDLFVPTAMFTVIDDHHIQMTLSTTLDSDSYNQTIYFARFSVFLWDRNQFLLIN